MKLLLDTHYVIWMGVERERMTTRDAAVLTDPASEIYVSVLSIWEIRIKWNSIGRSGQRKGLLSPESALRVAGDSGLKLISLDVDDVVIPLTRPIPHGDPFDEMLLVQAGRIGAKLLTRDDKLRDHPLALHP